MLHPAGLLEQEFVACFSDKIQFYLYNLIKIICEGRYTHTYIYICKYSHIFNGEYSYFNLLPAALRIMHVEQIKPEEDSLPFYLSL